MLDYDVRGKFPYAALTWHLQGTTEPAATAGTARHYVYDEAGHLLGEYAARYLAAFCYRFNRRFDLRTLHQRLLIAAVTASPRPLRSIRVADVRC